MFLRSHRGFKDGKEHRYFSVDESRQLQSGKVVQRRVLYLGEINDTQQAACRRTLDVFDESEQRYRTRSLFPEDRAIPADALASVHVKLNEVELRWPRAFGNCWLGCELSWQLELDWFWQQRPLPKEGQEITCQNVTFRMNRKKLAEAELRDGHYLLRTNLTGEDLAVLWDRYIQLTQIEMAFKCLKSDLGLRPLYHQLEHRVEVHAPGLIAGAVLEKLATIQMLDVRFPTTDGRWLVMPPLRGFTFGYRSGYVNDN